MASKVLHVVEKLLINNSTKPGKHLAVLHEVHKENGNAQHDFAPWLIWPFAIDPWPESTAALTLPDFQSKIVCGP